MRHPRAFSLAPAFMLTIVSRPMASKVDRLRRDLARLPHLTVALSGGVDSAVLLALAASAMPGRVTAVTTSSAAVPAEEIADAASLAASLGVPHEVVATSELEDPAYRANDGERCYFCRREMYGVLTGRGAVADGLNADDIVADRAGVRAAAEHGVLHPLRDHGLTKAEIRRLARGFGLSVHDKPAQPCLASRIRTGDEVTAERLARVGVAENAVRRLGYRVFRVRLEDRHARVEVGREQLADALADADRIESVVRAAGFETATVDPSGYGSTS